MSIDRIFSLLRHRWALKLLSFSGAILLIVLFIPKQDVQDLLIVDALKWIDLHRELWAPAILTGFLIAAISYALRRDRVSRQQLAELNDELRETSHKLGELEGVLQTASAGVAVQIHHFAATAPRTALVETMIKSAQQTVEIVGVVNDMLGQVGELTVPEFLGRGGRLRALFINPDGDAVHQREEIERTHQARQITRGSFARRTRDAINRLEEFRNQDVSVKVYERQPAVSMLLIDRKWALFHYYDVSSIGIDTPAFEVDARAATAAQVTAHIGHLCQKFDTLWNLPTSSSWEWGAE